MADQAQPPPRILLVTPYPWTSPHPVNEHVAELADGLLALHDADERVPTPVVIAPSGDSRSRRLTRRAVRELAREADPAEVLASPELAAPAPGTRRPRDPSHEWPMLSLPIPTGPASVGLRAWLRVLLERVDWSLVHAHDPLVNDLTRSVVRRWSGLTLATFHDPPPAATLGGTLPTPLRDRVLDGIDRWLVPGDDAAERLLSVMDASSDSAPLAPEVVPVVATSWQSSGAAPHAPRGRMIIVGRGDEDDALVRDLVRDLAPLLDERLDLSVTLLSRWEAHHRPVTPRALRGRLFSVHAPTREQADAVLAGGGVYIALPGTHERSRQEAQAAGLPVLELPHARGGDDTRAAVHAAILAALADGAGGGSALPDREQLARMHMAQYDALRERVQVHIAPRRAGEHSCVVDLHMHTSHSWDCATEPEVLLYAARKVGLTAVAVTDHNEISGALACAELAEEYGVQVIVGEEIKTTQGEVIGLFLTERIEPGLGWHETLAQIRAQDALVYVPHPFDRLHTIPDVHLLRDTIDEIDAFETWNARLAFDQYNRDAERFARKYNLVEGAGSDAHVVQGLGTAAVHMPAWDDRESFLLALAQGNILKRPKSLLYLQGLKWVNDLTGRSRRLPAEAVGRDDAD